MAYNKRKIGDKTETVAANYLKEHGYHIVQHNFRCRQGEIDIVAWDGDTLCFVEVKYRSSTKYGYPEESVNAAKQRRICRTALFYMSVHQITCGVRFDVISILPSGIRLIKNAFEYR